MHVYTILHIFIYIYIYLFIYIYIYTYKILHIRKRLVVQVRKIGGHDTRVGLRGQKGLYAPPSVYTHIVYVGMYLYMIFHIFIYVYMYI